MFVPISNDDVLRIVDLMNRAYRADGSASGWSTQDVYLAGDRITEALLRADRAASPDAAILKWEDAQTGFLQGCVWLEPLGEDVWYLGSLAIDPSLQAGGLGRTLLSAAEDWVRAKGGQCVRMRVINVREALIAWYVRRGYSLTGETEPFPYGSNPFGTPLRDDLSFVVLEKIWPPPRGENSGDAVP